MKKLAILFIAAATIGFAAPASAQVSVGIGDGGVGVRIGSDRDRSYRRDRGHHRGWRHRDARVSDCRTIKTRTTTPRGRVIIETKRICG